MAWDYIESAGDGGYLKVMMGKHGGALTDVTEVRGIPTQIESYTFGDPFGPATAVLRFPAITGFDDIDGRGGTGVGKWLADYAEVIIYYIPQSGSGLITDPKSNRTTAGEGTPQELWRGFVATIDLPEAGSGISVSCQGVLFQLDRYIQKPFYPPRPQAMEHLCRLAFSKQHRPALRFAELQVQFPDGWALLGKGEKQSPFLVEGVNVGGIWTGYASRNTGSWDRALTGYVQDLLSVMYVPDEAQVQEGNQWTIMPEGNVPIMKVRDRLRPVDFTVSYGQPGVKIRITRDTGPVANLIYGDGTGFDGVVWRNAVISNDGEYTEYVPLAAIRQVYPVSTDIAQNPIYDPRYWVNEQLYKYGNGFDLDTAINSSEKSLVRDVEPGWNGSMELEVDPSVLMSKYQIKAGMTVLIKNLMGTGENGVRFHIADVQHSPMQGRVEMKLDTRYRDLLNLEESQVRTRDPLTPAKMLQVNRRSVLIEDILAPWDYAAGSGYVPKTSVQYFKEMEQDAKQERYPWKNYIRGSGDNHDDRPRYNKEAFVRINANAPTRKKRWTIIPVVLSQKGTIRLSQFAAYKADGQPALCPFHVSIYDRKVTTKSMPKDGGGPSPFIEHAFESIDPSTGLPWEKLKGSTHYPPPDGFIIGWGNKEQKAGYSPGRSSDGHKPTGLLYDEATWTYDFTNMPDFKRQAGVKQRANAISVWVAFYAEFTEDVYIIGRFYRAEPGV